MPSTRRCETGLPQSRPPITASAQWSAPIPTPSWCASSSASSEMRHEPSASKSLAMTPISSLPVSAVGQMHAGTFAGFADTSSAELVGVEAAGGAALGHGVPGIVHGMYSQFLQDEAGQILRGVLDLCRP